MSTCFCGLAIWPRLSRAHLCTCSQVPVAGWLPPKFSSYPLGEGGDGLSHPLANWSAFQDKNRSCKVSRGLDAELAHHHFHYILCAQASHKVTLEPQVGNSLHLLMVGDAQLPRKGHRYKERCWRVVIICSPPHSLRIPFLTVRLFLSIKSKACFS